MERVLYLIFNIDALNLGDGQLLELLNQEELVQMNMRRGNHARLFVASRYVLKYWLSKLANIEPRSITIQFNGVKQRLEAWEGHTNLGYSVSISHSKSWLAIAVSENPVDIPLGIDIEVPKRGRNVLSIAKHSFADEEYQALQKESDPSKTFYLLWTLKEALCKATSLSLLKVLGLESQALLSSNQLQCIGIPSEDYAFSLVASATTKVSQIELTNVLSD